MPREVVESPSLELLKRCVNMDRSNTVKWWTCSVQSMVGRDDLKGLFQPK